MLLQEKTRILGQNLQRIVESKHSCRSLELDQVRLADVRGNWESEIEIRFRNQARCEREVHFNSYSIPSEVKEKDLIWSITNDQLVK